MKRLGILSAVFLLVLAGCGSVESYEKKIDKSINNFLDGMSDGYTIESKSEDKDANETFKMSIDGKDINVVINNKSEDLKQEITEIDGKIKICKNDKCNEELSTDLEKYYNYDDKYGMVTKVINKVIKMAIKGMSEMVTGGLTGGEISSSDGFHYVTYDYEGIKVKCGVSKNGHKLFLSTPRDDGSEGAITLYLNK